MHRCCLFLGTFFFSARVSRFTGSIARESRARPKRPPRAPTPCSAMDNPKRARGEHHPLCSAWDNIFGTASLALRRIQKCSTVQLLMCVFLCLLSGADGSTSQLAAARKQQIRSNLHIVLKGVVESAVEESIEVTHQNITIGEGNSESGR